MKYEGSDSFHFERNFWWASAFIAFFFFILFIRLWYLQILHGEDFRKFSEKNLFKESEIHAARGKIYDRDGKILAENLPAYKAVIIPQYTENLDHLAKDLGQAINVAPKEIIAKFKKSRRENGRFFPADIKLHLTKDEVFKVELLKLDHPGLDLQEFILRSYPMKGTGAHILGYVREISKREIPILRKRRNIPFKPKDIIGKNGLEESFDTSLRGKKGKALMIVDAKGRRAAQGTISAIGEFQKDIPAEAGTDIYTTIDSDLQKAAYESFVKHEQVGSLVALSPEGEVLAWVSHPPYDPNVFSKRVSPKIWRQWVNNPARPLRNKVIQDHYSPGSTFKPIMALAALQEGVITADKYIDAPSRIRIGRKMFHDHFRADQGFISVAQAIERSSNTFFYKMGKELGIDNIAKYSMALGFGKKTNVPLRGEVPGLIPTKEWKEKRYGEPWQLGETISVSIGQSFVLTTAIQLAQAYSAIALDGKVYEPQIIKKISNDKADIYQTFEPRLVRDLSSESSEVYIDKKHFKTVRHGLYRVANGSRGTAKWAKLTPPYKMAGKTGTTQVRGFKASELFKDCSKRPRKQRHNGWYVAYAPLKQPEITVAVLTEHSCSSAKSVPIVRDVIQSYLNKYHNLEVNKDKEG